MVIVTMVMMGCCCGGGGGGVVVVCRSLPLSFCQQVPTAYAASQLLLPEVAAACLGACVALVDDANCPSLLGAAEQLGHEGLRRAAIGRMVKRLAVVAEVAPFFREALSAPQRAALARLAQVTASFRRLQAALACSYGSVGLVVPEPSRRPFEGAHVRACHPRDRIVFRP